MPDIHRKVYADLQPKILLEVLSAQSASLTLALTYITFILCFTIDVWNTSRAFGDSSYYFQPNAINDTNNITLQKLQSTSNHHLRTLTNIDPISTYSWNTTVYDVKNIISIQVSVSQSNISSLINNTTDTTATATTTTTTTTTTASTCDILTLYYDVTLWACYQSSGCSDQFSDSTRNNNIDIWHPVLQLTQQDMNIDKCALKAPNYKLIQSIIPNTFQNQESLPTNGAVKSYYIDVHYYKNPSPLFIPTTADIAKSITYTIRLVHRPFHGLMSSAAIVVITICLLCAIIGFFSFLRYMIIHESDPRKWLPEQKWTILSLFFLIIYLNPIYCVVFWYTNTLIVSSAVYMSYVLDAIGQAGFFFVWLCFARPLSSRFQSWTMFYIPKLCLILGLFISYMIILTLQFPSLVPSLSAERSPVQAVQNWPILTQRIFIFFSLVYMILQLVWAMTWLYSLFTTGKQLSKLPYMSTRYMQLSFRFFTLQASLVTLYYLVQYSTVLYYMVRNDHSHGTPTVTQLADDINTLFREQTQLFGKLIFLTVYTLILAFLFLPSSTVTDSQGLTSKLAATYVITESELKKAISTRKKTMKQLNKMQQSLLTNVSSYQPYIFCTQLALDLCNLSNEAYYDPPGRTSGSALGHRLGHYKDLDLESYGYSYIDSRTDDDHDTFCCIARHQVTRRLLIVFRGTSSRKHWNDNVKLRQTPVDILNLPPETPHYPSNWNSAPIVLPIPGNVLTTPQESVPYLSAESSTNKINKKKPSFSSGEKFAVTPMKSKHYNRPPLIPTNNTSRETMQAQQVDTVKPSSKEFRRLVADAIQTEHIPTNDDEYKGEQISDPHQSNACLSPLNMLHSNPSYVPVTNTSAEERMLSDIEGGQMRILDKHSDAGERADNIRHSVSDTMSTNMQMPVSQSVPTPSTSWFQSLLTAIKPSIYWSQVSTRNGDTENTTDLRKSITHPLHQSTDAYDVLPASAEEESHDITINVAPSTEEDNILYEDTDGEGNRNDDSRKKSTPKRKFSIKRTLKNGTKVMTGGVSNIANTMLEATGTAVGAVTATATAAEAAVRNVAEHTPVLKEILVPYVHTGFWEAYSVVREFIHSVIRMELLQEPGDILLSGHSLGGALATLCALDLGIHSIPQINKQLMDGYYQKRRMTYTSPSTRKSRLFKSPSLSFFPRSSSSNNVNTDSDNIGNTSNSKSTSWLSKRPLISFGGNRRRRSTNTSQPSSTASQSSKQSNSPPNPIHITMYNYGSPRVGNSSFAQLYDKVVPDSYRITVDGDIVVSVPKYGYKHIGTEVLIDGLGGSGSIIIGPSFVERRLRVQPKSSVSAHSLEAYRKGLTSIIEAATYLSHIVTNVHKGRHPYKLKDVSTNTSQTNMNNVGTNLQTLSHSNVHDSIALSMSFDSNMYDRSTGSHTTSLQNSLKDISGAKRPKSGQYVLKRNTLDTWYSGDRINDDVINNPILSDRYEENMNENRNADYFPPAGSQGEIRDDGGVLDSHVLEFIPTAHLFPTTAATTTTTIGGTNLSLSSTTVSYNHNNSTTTGMTPILQNMTHHTRMISTTSTNSLIDLDYIEIDMIHAAMAARNLIEEKENITKKQENTTKKPDKNTSLSPLTIKNTTNNMSGSRSNIHEETIGVTKQIVNANETSMYPSTKSTSTPYTNPNIHSAMSRPTSMNMMNNSLSLLSFMYSSNMPSSSSSSSSSSSVQYTPIQSTAIDTINYNASTLQTMMMTTTMNPNIHVHNESSTSLHRIVLEEEDMKYEQNTDDSIHLLSPDMLNTEPIRTDSESLHTSDQYHHTRDLPSLLHTYDSSSHDKLTYEYDDCKYIDKEGEEGDDEDNLLSVIYEEDATTSTIYEGKS